MRKNAKYPFKTKLNVVKRCLAGKISSIKTATVFLSTGSKKFLFNFSFIY